MVVGCASRPAVEDLWWKACSGSRPVVGLYGGQPVACTSRPCYAETALVAAAMTVALNFESVLS